MLPAYFINLNEISKNSHGKLPGWSVLLASVPMFAMAPRKFVSCVSYVILLLRSYQTVFPKIKPSQFSPGLYFCSIRTGTIGFLHLCANWISANKKYIRALFTGNAHAALKIYFKLTYVSAPVFVEKFRLVKCGKNKRKKKHK